jgi:hypothetical protein
VKISIAFKIVELMKTFRMTERKKRSKRKKKETRRPLFPACFVADL